MTDARLMLRKNGYEVCEQEIVQEEVDEGFKCSSCSKVFELYDDVLIVSGPHSSGDSYHCGWDCLDGDYAESQGV